MKLLKTESNIYKHISLVSTVCSQRRCTKASHIWKFL